MALFVSFISILIPIVNSYNLALPVPKNADTYGPYNYICKALYECPKVVAVATLSANLTYDKMNYVVDFDISIPYTLRFDEVKVTFNKVTNGYKTLKYSYTLDNPCQHSILSGLMRTRLNAHNCVIKKGDYFLTVNLSEVVKKFYGSNFFYGEYEIKVSGHSKKQVVTCVFINEIFAKKST